ncbi:MAG: hypothetical protein ABSF48_11300 [Thermodesulfobacteriota bacterium]
MKMYSIIGVIVFSILIGPMAAMGHTIDDTYWGGLLNPGAQYPSDKGSSISDAQP